MPLADPHRSVHVGAPQNTPFQNDLSCRSGGSRAVLAAATEQGGQSAVVASLLVCRSLLAPRALRSSLPSSASHRRFGRVVTREGRSARGWSCDARRGAWGVRAARLSASPSPRSALVMRTLAGARRSEGAVRVMRRTKRRRETTAERPPRAANAAVNSPRARAESARRVRVEPERRALSSASDLALFCCSCSVSHSARVASSRSPRRRERATCADGHATHHTAHRGDDQGAVGVLGDRGVI